MLVIKVMRRNDQESQHIFSLSNPFVIETNSSQKVVLFKNRGFGFKFKNKDSFKQMLSILEDSSVFIDSQVVFVSFTDGDADLVVLEIAPSRIVAPNPIQTPRVR